MEDNIRKDYIGEVSGQVGNNNMGYESVIEIAW